MSIRVGEGTRVTLAYRLQTERGDVLEERTPENPFEFVFGTGQTLPAIENVIRGKTEGFTASLGVAAKEAYGEFDDQLVATVSIASFPQPNDIQVGMKFTTQGPNGEELAVRVVEVLEDQVTVDGNHPLAGVDIEIDLKILRIEEDTGQDDDPDDNTGEDSRSESGSGGRTLH
ncbi:MAG: FKBP-type peptidyl-prolyl cis-trans isomerase [Bdellovibrionales bacterium]|nr:FKBP-type peptidyl-prolyl cis-trans isomerase [Bdellovibrionales bacterium]